MIDYTLTINAGSVPSFKMYLDKDFTSDRFILESIQAGSSYETDVTNIMVRALKPGDCMFDVGANVGYFSLMAAALVGPTGKVLAFEPGENNLPRLKDNIKLNKFDNIDVIEKPAWSHQTELMFWLNHDNSGGDALWDPGLWPGNPKSRAVPISRMLKTTTLDRVYLQPPRVIKLDIEGAEYHVMVGAFGLLNTHKPPFVIAEWNAFAFAQMDCSGNDLRRLMRRHGYDMFLIDGTGAKPQRVAHTDKMELPDTVIINVLFSTQEAVDEIWEKQDVGVDG